jgi:3-carboxy-cis,cis-muconate cycloisomerase
VTTFAPIFVPDELSEALSDQAWLEGLLEAELALVNACSLAGVVPAASASQIAEACNASQYDAHRVAEAGRVAGNPVEPLVVELRRRVGETHARFVHYGATSQDILDSAAMLVSRRSLALIDDDLAAVAALCAGLADEHRGTVMAARTLLQQAVPTTFGAKAAVWLVGIVEGRSRLQEAAERLPAQLGGAAGTLAAYGERGPEVLRLYAAELDLREPVVPWHTARGPVAELGAALALGAGALGKIARDVLLLAQTEVGEVAERDSGVSSTMPNKQNPIGAVLAVACERHARVNAGLLLESVVAEHERAAGAWHAEWSALTAALASTGGAAAAVRRSLHGLQVNAARMRANVREETLAEAKRFGIAAASPEEYLGSVDAFVDRARALWDA